VPIPPLLDPAAAFILAGLAHRRIDPGHGNDYRSAGCRPSQ
jgi:hypothetical protein